MRRLAHITGACLLLLSACGRQGNLTPDEVLRRSTEAHAQLASAAFNATASLVQRDSLRVVNTTAQLKGTLSHGGEQVAFSADVRGTVARPGQGTVTFHLAGDVVSEPQRAYARIGTFSVEPSLGSGALQTLLNTWWMVPRADGSSAQSLTPDPRLLRAQAAVVTVTWDKGLESIHGADAYRYSVTVDPDRLIALMKAAAEQRGTPFDEDRERAALAPYDAAGELWIDASTFLLHRMEWTVATPESSHTTSLTFTADLTQHNAAPPIILPQDAKPLDPEAFFQVFSSIPGLFPADFAP